MTSPDPPPNSDDLLSGQVDAVCDRFEAAWKSGSPPQIEDYFEKLRSDSDNSLLLELLKLDVEYRTKHGETPMPQDYVTRFPEHAALIRDHVVNQTKTVPPDRDLIARPKVISKHEPPAASSRRRVGPYKLLQKLGEGGMGTVYMADQQEPVRRRVALKLVKSGMDSARVLARFEAERQALAMMDHQNIARVLDAGITEDGTPYFAMDLVQGIPITDYCDRAKLNITERLGLFVQVCRALQHAHQKGIIHRDIKPSNVLVAQRDGVPVAKVIDFGLAKALQGEIQLTDKTLFTEMGQVFGTLEYMSPEQAESSELGLDTRTDVYSLGVLLYELLTGSTPLGRDRVRKEAYHRVLELILIEETPRPSHRLSESGDKITGISQQRKIDPRRLHGILKGELDWIALRALEKERNRRYDSSGSLADDVQNYLDGDMVLARPPSAGYRLSKTVQKYKAAFITGTVFVLLLMAGLIGMGSMYLRASKAEQTAVAEAEKTKFALQKQLAAEQDRLTTNFQRLAESRNETPFAALIEQLRLTPQQVISLAIAELARTAAADASEEAKEILATRQANSAILLLLLGENDAVWPLLKHSPDPRVRSYIIHWLSLRGGDPGLLMSRFAQETDVTIKRALLLCLGEFEDSAFGSDEREMFIDTLRTAFLTHADPGLHSAAEWLLHRWGIAPAEEQLQLSAEQPTATQRQWYITGQGQTYAILDAGQFMMGSPKAEEDYSFMEVLHRRQLGRRFAICTKEVTRAQWHVFAEGKNVRKAYGSHRDLDLQPDDSPMAAMTWYEAAWYCNWLSEQEGIPEEEWCYEVNADGRYEEGMKAREQFWELNGYRLPTESEWEFACRSGTTTSRYFGQTQEFLMEYVRSHQNSENHAWPVGGLKPNDFGLFDMQGNVSEWCYDKSDIYPMMNDDSVVSDFPDCQVVRASSLERRVVRGGAFNWRFYGLRSANRYSYQADIPISQIGFRPARTWKSDWKQDGPYTSWYDNGQKKREGTVRNGQRDGLITEWHNNGQKKFEYTFRNGKQDGPFISWYDNGQQQNEGTTRNGKQVGPYTSWYDNGQKQRESTVRNGPFTEWHDNGRKSGEGAFRNAKWDGLITFWYDNGQKKEAGNWLDGKFIAGVKWDEKGNRISTIGNSIGMSLALLSAGTFQMGDGPSVYEVILTQPFYMGTHEVTQKQYQRVTGNNYSSFRDPQNPVENVTWSDARDFCRKLSALPEEMSAGRVYRLPSEAEWEYACRAGTTTKFSFGDNESQLNAYGWFKSNSGETTHPVGRKKPNPWGLYDMHGNVHEWCQDWYAAFPRGFGIDPMGPLSGPTRLIKGGSWSFDASYSRSTTRFNRQPNSRFGYTGFRVCLSPPGTGGN